LTHVAIPVAANQETTAAKLNWPNSRIQEFGLLLRRCVLLASRDWMTLAAQFGQTIFLCLLLSFTFFQLGTDFGGVQGRLGLLFFVSISTIFTTVTPLLHVFATDRAILMRERAGATYRVLPGYSAKFVSLAPLSLLLLLLFALPLYFIVGLTMPFDRLLVFLAILAALRLAAIGMGLMLASFSPSLQVSMIVGPLMITVFLLYGGNLTNSNDITWILRWLQYISVIFYSYEALCQNEFTDNYYGVQNDNVTLVPGTFYLNLYGLNKVGIWGCFGAILGLGTAFLVSGYIGLRWLTKPRITFI
jgi:ABC-type multidrug transport system permease subunit